jgi:DNA-binding PadR family transcriptional regulator
MGTAPEQRTPLSPPAFHILLALAEGPLHGYALMQQVADAGVKVGPGTIYGALHRMQEAGWVKPAGAEKARGRSGQRQRYGLTRAGRSVLQTEARRVVHTADLVLSPLVPGSVRPANAE